MKKNPRSKSNASTVLMENHSEKASVIEEDDRLGVPSASGMERLIGRTGCPGSFQMERHLSDPRSNAAARRGTNIHEVLEGKRPIAHLSHSDKICAERLGFEEGKLVEKYGFEGATQIKEKRFWVYSESGAPLFSGKPDVVHMLKKKALVVNYKTGFYEPTPINKNAQMLTEATVVASEYKWIFDIITVSLIHPNFKLANGEISQTYAYTKEELRWNSLSLLTISAQNALKDDAKRYPSEKACRWCLGAKNNCCPEHIEAKENNQL